MKPITKSRLILGGLVAVHVGLYFYVWHADRYFPLSYVGLPVSQVLPTQGVLLGFWVAMGRRWTIPWRVALIAAVLAILADVGYVGLGSLPREYQVQLLVGEFCLIAVTLLTARTLGLRLGHTATPTESHSLFQFSLLEIFSWITATAISLRIFKSVPVEVLIIASPWLYFGLSSAIYVCVFLTLISLACVWVVFGRRWLVLRILAGVVLPVSFAATFAGMTRFVFLQVYMYFFSSYVLWLIASFLVIRWAGYRLEWRWRFGRNRRNTSDEKEIATT